MKKKSYIKTDKFIEVKHKGSNRKSRHVLYKTVNGSYFYYLKDADNKKMKRYVRMKQQKKGGADPEVFNESQEDDVSGFNENYPYMKEDNRTKVEIATSIGVQLQNMNLTRETLLCLEKEIEKNVNSCNRGSVSSVKEPSTNNNWWETGEIGKIVKTPVPNLPIEHYKTTDEHGLTDEERKELNEKYGFQVLRTDEEREELIEKYKNEKNINKKRKRGGRKNKGGSK